MQQYLFSQFKADELERLHGELSKVFDIRQSELQSLYETMRIEFEMDSPSQKTLPRLLFRSHNPSFQKRYDEALVVGIDIPILLEKNDEVLEKRTIVILAQDPLRKSSKRVEEIVVGTPYTLHRKSNREIGRSSAYFDLIKVLLDKSYRIYLTDIFKLWISQPDQDQGIPLCKQDSNRFLQILKPEIEIFEPLAIITWGQKASDAVKGLDLVTGHHLEFPHPSSAANGKWRQLMGKSPTRDNKIEYWSQKVFDCLAE